MVIRNLQLPINDLIILSHMCYHVYRKEENYFLLKKIFYAFCFEYL